MRKIWLVDAFTDAPYRGNPAAVMLVEEFPSDTAQVAAEMKCSETAFLKEVGEGRWHIRWFTPLTEVKLCGHATLAAAHVLFSEGYVVDDEVMFDSLSGPLVVKREGQGFVLDFPLQKVKAPLDASVFGGALNLNAKDIVEVVQAEDDAIVVVYDDAIVWNFSPDFVQIAEVDQRAVILTAPSDKYDFVSRFFAPKVGIDEDPVTGSAHCKLADYWSRKLKKQTLYAYQASQRGGSMDIVIQGCRVFLKGRAVTILEGIWKV